MASQTGIPASHMPGTASLPGSVERFTNKHDAGPAIVLSGGGAKGDFEVGAVRCLYDHGVRPKILCGTSVGSINALKLAEGEADSPTPVAAPAGHVRGLAGLEKIWLDLTSDGQMWSLEPGVASIFSTIANLPAEFKKLQMEVDDVGSTTFGAIISSIVGMPGLAPFVPQLFALDRLSNDGKELIRNLTATLKDAENIVGLANYDPLEKTMRMPTSFFPSHQQHSGIKLRLAMVALEDGALRYVTETNIMTENNGTTTKVKPPATAAEIAALKAKRAAIMEAIADLAPEPPDGHGNHSTGGVQKPSSKLGPLKRQLALLNAELARDSVQYDLIRAAIASSSLPVICRPTSMQDGLTYIDGGIRTLAPIQSAIDAGASQVYAIAAGSSKFDVSSMAEIGASSPLPLMGIALRVGEQILPDEVGHRDLFPANPWPVPVVVIQPDPSLDDIHDGLTIEPGLIRIRMAYGFMRAYDTVKAFEKFVPSHYQYAAQQNSIKGKTMEIVKLRKQIWDLEFPANGKEFVAPTSALPPAPYTVKNLPSPVAGAHKQVLALKQQLKTLVSARIAFYTDANGNGVASLPADFNDWSTKWEHHSWTPTIPL
jgi:NTE family protein